MPQETNNKTAQEMPQDYFARYMASLGQEYQALPMDSVYQAFMGAGGMGYMLNWPYIQNKRVKSVNSLPANFSKDDIEQMVAAPEGNEQALRQVSAALASSTKTYDLILQTYQDVLTYDWYVYPGYTPEKPDKATQLREYAMAIKLAETMNIKAKAHEIVGLCAQYGKVFYTPRISMDKSHGKVNYAFLQQLPEDYIKIVGWNNGPGKYTIAFNLMYFVQPGNDWRQFGDLFRPYMQSFYSVVQPEGKYVYSSQEHRSQNYRIDTDKFETAKMNELPGAPEWQYAGNKWFYWVILPADKVFSFEIVDRNALMAPPTTGMMVSLTQIPNYEAAQMEVILNPLTSVLTGSLETYDPKQSSNADPVRVSEKTRRLFEAYWYQMLQATNTSGIGLYLAPADDLKLQTLSDTVSNTNITSTALNDQILKAGLTALIPTTNDPKVGVAQLSAQIQARYPMLIYWAIERMMNWVFEQQRFKCPFKFRMFGDIFSRKEEIESARQGATLGILPETLKYDALMGHSLLDDMAISDFVSESGILDKRKPLVTSYSAKQDTSGLPPQEKKDLNPGGRPAEDGSINGEVTEKVKIDARLLDELRRALE